MYQQYNPFLQPYQPQQRGMGSYMQDVQSSRAMQNMDPRLQQEAMARHQAALQQHMAQQQRGMQQNPFAGLSQQQQDMLGLQQETQEFERQIADGRDMMAEREQYLSNIPEAQRAQAGRQFDDHYARVGWTPPQQPGPNVGPQPGPGEMIQQRQAPFMGDRVGPGQNFAQRFGGQQFGPGFNFPMPQFGGQQSGPQQPNPQFGPQQEWTPPSVNMPMSQQGQPWMGNEMQQRYSVPQRQQSAPQQNPFMRMNPFQGMSPGNPRNADRGTPANQPPIRPEMGGGAMPDRANPFAQLSQQSHRQIMPTFRR